MKGKVFKVIQIASISFTIFMIFSIAVFVISSSSNDNKQSQSESSQQESEKVLSTQYQSELLTKKKQKLLDDLNRCKTNIRETTLDAIKKLGNDTKDRATVVQNMLTLQQQGIDECESSYDKAISNLN